MTIKDLAYRTHKRLSSDAAARINRSHVYELLAAAFGYRSYAAFCTESVFMQLPPSMELQDLDVAAIRQRSIDLGYVETIGAITAGMVEELQTARLGVVRIQDIVDKLLGLPHPPFHLDPDGDEAEAYQPDRPSVHDIMDFDLDQERGYLLESLESAANRSNALAHYALALLYGDDEEDAAVQPPGSAYWHQQRLSGEHLSAAANQWADEYERQTDRASKSSRHLREAARLGNTHALLDLADLDGDPTFFETAIADSIKVDAMRAAEIARELDRPADEHRWLTKAAERGDIEAMEALIESFDRDDSELCWTWVHLGRLLGTDLTRSDMRAYHDGGPQDGQEYDDDFGGGAYVAGREAIDLDPLSEEAEHRAAQRAAVLYERLRGSDTSTAGSRTAINRD